MKLKMTHCELLYYMSVLCIKIININNKRNIVICM